MACDITRKEVKILTNTVNQQDYMLNYRKEEIEKLQAQLIARDELLQVRQELIDISMKKEIELQSIIKREKRRKKANKWFYGGLGLLGGFGLSRI